MNRKKICANRTDFYWIRNYQVDNNIAELRHKAGLSQQELGDALGLSRNAIASIERGAAYPTIRLAFVLAKYFDESVEEIFTLRSKELC